MPKIDIHHYMRQVAKFYQLMGWKKDWQRGGCYMHLETSEFIEALRGKGDPVDELGDVLCAVLAVAHWYNIDPIEAIASNRKKMKRIMDEKRKEKSIGDVQ